MNLRIKPSVRDSLNRLIPDDLTAENTQYLISTQPLNVLLVDFREMKTQFLTLFLTLALSYPAAGQETSDTGGVNSQSGYEDLPEFGGPESVASELKRNDADRDGIYQFDSLQRNLAPYFDWKRRVHDENGFAMGFQFYALYQQASSSLDGEDDDALGNIFRFQGNWTVFQRDNGNLGRIEYRVESRSNIGGFQAPGSLGPAAGISTLGPGFGYSDSFDLDIPVINWTQGFANGKAGYAVGRLAFDVYLDAFPFQTFSRGFINRSFILNPTLPTTGIGAIGGVVKGFVSDNVWLGAQMHDANAASGDFEFNTVKEGEWLKAVEFGFTPSFGQRKKQLIQFTYWEKDARELAGTPSGNGWAISAAYQLSERYFPFIRFGHSNGGGGVAAESAISAGVEITQSFDQVWTIGAGWAKPSSRTFGPGLDNETVLETSYKFQLSKNFSLTPDLQVVFNPANDPSESSVWVFGFRAILTM
jgi:porin